MSIRQRWLLFGGLLVLLSIVALRASMPTAMSAGLRAWLEAQGASDVFVGEIRLRLLDGQLELDGLSFTAGGEESRVGSTRFELAWSSTDTRRLWLKRIAIDGLRTRIAIADDGSTTLAGLLPSGNKDATDAGAFVVMVDEANLSDGEIIISHRGADHHLRLNAVTAGFGITPEAAAAGFSVLGAWNGSPDSLRGQQNAHIEGGAITNLQDYAKILLMHLRGGRCGDTQVMSAESVAFMQVNRAGDLGVDYGMSWWIAPGDAQHNTIVYDPGAFGAISWLDMDRGIGGYVAIDDYTRANPGAVYELVLGLIIPLQQQAVDAARSGAGK